MSRQKAGESICGEDQHGNNLKPYAWRDGPMHWFGQDVLYWMGTEEPDGLRNNPEWQQRCKMNLQAQQRFVEQFTGLNIDCIEDDMVTALSELT